MDKKIVIARIQVIQGKEEEYLSLVSPFIEAAKSEVGNLVYTVYQGIRDASEFMVYEEYVD